MKLLNKPISVGIFKVILFIRIIKNKLIDESYLWKKNIQIVSLVYE